MVVTVLEWESEEEEEEAQAEGLVVESESDDENADNCPICLNRFKDQDVGTPEACDHNFCLECIQEWANVRNSENSSFNISSMVSSQELVFTLYPSQIVQMHCSVE